MTIEEIQSTLEGRGTKYTAEEVSRCVQAYGDIIPSWYAKLWTSAAIFEADMYVHEKELEDEPWAQVGVLRLDGPDDGWKKDDQVELTQGGYFSLGSWAAHAYWLITPSRSEGLGAPVHIIDHEVAGDLDEITGLEGINTFQDLLDSVVNWPILRAIDRWCEFMESEHPEPDPMEPFRGLSGAEMGRKLEEVKAEEAKRKANQDYAFGAVIRALEGRYPEPLELDEGSLELPEDIQQVLLFDRRRHKQRWDAAGIGPLPDYREGELPAALRYVWEHLEDRPLGPWRMQRGVALLHSLSAAFERGIPRHLFVVGQYDEQFVALDLTRPGEFGDCPVVTWPAGEELAPSLGDWLLAQVP